MVHQSHVASPLERNWKEGKFAWGMQMSRQELGNLRSCKGAVRKLLARLNIVKRVKPPCSSLSSTIVLLI